MDCLKDTFVYYTMTSHMTSHYYSKYLRLDVYVLEDAVRVQLILAEGGEVQVVVAARLAHRYHRLQPRRLNRNTFTRRYKR